MLWSNQEKEACMTMQLLLTKLLKQRGNQINILHKCSFESQNHVCRKPVQLHIHTGHILRKASQLRGVQLQTRPLKLELYHYLFSCCKFRGKGVKWVYTLCMYLHLDCLLWAYCWMRRQKKTPQSPPHQILAHHQNLWERVTWKSVWTETGTASRE